MNSSLTTSRNHTFPEIIDRTNQPTDPLGEHLMRVEHVAFNVEDPLEMARWYVEHLGFEVKRRVMQAPWAHFLVDSSGSTMICSSLVLTAIRGAGTAAKSAKKVSRASTPKLLMAEPQKMGEISPRR